MSDVTTQTPTEDASDAVKQGQQDAIENSKQDAAVRRENEKQLNDTLDDARDTAKENHKVDVRNQPDAAQTELKNDTSDKAKIDTTKAQLDPTGTDPNVSGAELKRAALDGENVEGGTSVSNKEAARRASESSDDNKTNTGAKKDAAGNPTLGNGETNVAADKDALHPAGGKADQSAKSSSDSANKN